MEKEELQSWMQKSVADIGTAVEEDDSMLLTKLHNYSSIGRISPGMIESSASYMVVHVMTVSDSYLSASSQLDYIKLHSPW